MLAHGCTLGQDTITDTDPKFIFWVTLQYMKSIHLHCFIGFEVTPVT